jgi:hypothetical protein
MLRVLGEMVVVDVVIAEMMVVAMVIVNKRIEVIIGVMWDK